MRAPDWVSVFLVEPVADSERNNLFSRWKVKKTAQRSKTEVLFISEIRRAGINNKQRKLNHRARIIKVSLEFKFFSISHFGPRPFELIAYCILIRLLVQLIVRFRCQGPVLTRAV